MIYLPSDCSLIRITQYSNDGSSMVDLGNMLPYFVEELRTACIKLFNELLNLVSQNQVITEAEFTYDH